MIGYRCLFILLVVLTNSAVWAADSLPQQPEQIQDYPSVLMPGSLDYATELIHRFNAQVDNPNFLIPNIESLKSDAKRGLQGWLPVLPDTSVFAEDVVYPLYRSGLKDGVLLLYLPPDRRSNIGLQIQERLRRFVKYSCLADGMPEPRPGRVSSSDYEVQNASWQGALLAGIILGFALLLASRALLGLRVQTDQNNTKA